MGLSDWRAKRNMRDPVRGVFRVTGFYDRHPSGSTAGTWITGIISAPGLSAMAAEHKADERGRWATNQELPVLVDRADPSRFAILWSEVTNVSWRDSEMANAQAQADRLNTGNMGLTGLQGVAGPGSAGSVWLEVPPTGRPMPGTPGGGLTPDQAQQMISNFGGVQATAIVLDVREVVSPGVMAAAPAGVVDLTLEVTLADGIPMTTATRVAFLRPERRQLVATVGARVPVRVNPNDVSQLAIDPSGLPD